MLKVDEPIPGLLVLEPRVFHDGRGYFFEIHQRRRYADLGLPPMVQDNLSRSRRDVVRGLHFQYPRQQGKLVQVVRGEIWDVAVDLREGSPTCGQWYGLRLDDIHHRQLYLSPGFAHGFAVLSDEADVLYKCTDYYVVEDEVCIHWADPRLGIDWPVKDPLLSERDAQAPQWAEIPPHRRPRYEP